MSIWPCDASKRSYRQSVSSSRSHYPYIVASFEVFAALPSTTVVSTGRSNSVRAACSGSRVPKYLRNWTCTLWIQPKAPVDSKRASCQWNESVWCQSKVQFQRMFSQEAQMSSQFSSKQLIDLIPLKRLSITNLDQVLQSCSSRRSAFWESGKPLRWLHLL